MQIVRYTHTHKPEWDTFVGDSKNGTFMFKRDYMEYHSDRFIDCSYLFYEKNKLKALLAGNISEDRKTFYSHQGLTYGGFVFSNEMTAASTLELFNEFLLHLKSQYGVEQVIYKPVPNIYHRYPAEEDLYALFRHDAKLVERKISSAIRMSDPIVFRQSRKGGISKARRYGLTVVETEDLMSFWKILNDALHTRHQTKAVHTLEEISLLKDRFPDGIHLFGVVYETRILGGCLVYEMGETVHIQYIAANEEGKALGALDLLFDYLIGEHYRNKRYFDFGTSVEQGGHVLNEGLIFQKEGFGGRAVMYDTYLINNL